MAAHTPAPWSFKLAMNQSAQEGTTVAMLAPNASHATRAPYWIYSDAETHGDREADARLIAAAPELLAALKQIKCLAPPGTLFREDAEDAIAKAVGVKS